MLLHGFADSVIEEPCRLLSNTALPGYLVRADAFLGAGHQVKGHKPFANRDSAFFKNRADPNGELLAAISTLVNATPNWALGLNLAGQGIDILAPTARANRAVRPALLFQELASGVFVGKDRCHRS